MAATSYPAATAFTRLAEGGWSDNPADPGGATMQGITLATYTTWCKQMGRLPPTAAGLKAITAASWNAIAATLYWNPVQGDQLPGGVDLLVWDFGFNAGVHTTGLVLQKALGFTGDDLDGWIGADTLKAIAAIKTVSALIVTISSKQADYYRSLSTFQTFGKGWIARNDARRAAALGIVPGYAPVGLMPVAMHPLALATPPTPTADDLNAAQIVSDTSI